MKTEETKSCETCRLHFDSNKRCNSLIRCIGGSQWESKQTPEEQDRNNEPTVKELSELWKKSGGVGEPTLSELIKIYRTK